jgi:hypothetical protein
MENGTKINHLLSLVPPNVVMQSAWLSEKGYSLSLQQRYRSNHWLDSIGSGAMIRMGDEVSYEGGVYALQKQSGLSIHPGGRTALTLLGKAHYLEMVSQKVVLFGNTEEKLPTWFKNHKWQETIEYHPTSFLPSNLGLTEVELKNFSIKVSNPARAVMECLYIAPKHYELSEVYELLEGLNNLKPSAVQELLEQCESVKVKRLFLFMAEKAEHTWFKHLNLERIDLGTGKRSIVEKGVYVSKYQITIPAELNGKGSL